MKLSAGQFFVNDKLFATVSPVKLEPMATASNVRRCDNKVEFQVKFTDDGWEQIAKALARVHQIEVSSPIPGIKKGDTITMHHRGFFEDRDVTGILYHIRKPYRDSETRIYFIREEFSGIPKAA